MANWIEWRPDYRVGVDKIDEQHEALFRMFNELGDALWDGKGREVIGDALKFLAQYTVNHFRTEEEFMRSCRYPGYVAHKKLHDELVQEVSEFIVKFESDELPHSAVLAVVNRVGNWTRDHVRGMDQEMAAFISERERLAS